MTKTAQTTLAMAANSGAALGGFPSVPAPARAA